MNISQDKHLSTEKALGAIGQGSMLVFFGLLINFGFSFMIRILLVRHFGQSLFGMLRIGSAIMMMVIALAPIGINSGITRFLALYKGEGKDREARIITLTGVVIVGITSITFSFFLFFFSENIAGLFNSNIILVDLIQISALIIPFFVLFKFNMAVFRGHNNMKIIVMLKDILQFVLYFMGVVFVAVMNLNVTAVPYVNLVSILSVLIVSIFYLQKRYSFFSNYLNQTYPGSNLNIQTCTSKKKFPGIIFENISLFYAKKLILFSVPLSLSTITIMFRKRFSIILIGFYLSPSLVGLYSTAEPVARLLTLFIQSIGKTLLPITSHLLGEGGQDQIGIIYKTTTRWLVMLTLPLFFILLIFPEFLLIFIFGEPSGSAAWVLRILAIGTFINASTGSFGQILQMYGKTDYFFMQTTSGTLINLVLLIFLVPKYGIIGAAISISLSIIWNCILGIYLVFKHSSIHPFSRDYFKTLFVGCIILVNMMWIYRLPTSSLGLFLSVFIILIVVSGYFLVLYISGVLKEREILFLKKRIHKVYSYLLKIILRKEDNLK